MINVYDILLTIPHNAHYLTRYIKFIKYCKINNKNLSDNTYFEKHHICPKAKDMFFEYQNLNHYPENRVDLTARQHYIAHLLLHKSYNTTSTLFSFVMMSRLYSSSKLFEKSKMSIRNMFIAKDKENIHHYIKNTDERYLTGELVSINKNKIVVRGSNNKIIQIENTDSAYLEGSFTHINKGKSVYKNEEGISKSLSIKHPDVLSGKVVGHTKGVAVMKDKNNNILAVSLEDERIKTGELVGSQKGKISINNGITNKRIYPTEIIPEGWVKGLIRPNGPKGRIWITNGVDSKMIKPEEIIPDGWLKGRTVNKIWIHNFYESKQLDKHLHIPVGWVKGMAPQ